MEPEVVGLGGYRGYRGSYCKDDRWLADVDADADAEAEVEMELEAALVPELLPWFDIPLCYHNKPYCLDDYRKDSNKAHRLYPLLMFLPHNGQHIRLAYQPQGPPK